MAKLFYSLQEAAAKLGKTTDEVMALVEAGRLREFRDASNNLTLKVDEVKLLSGDSGGSMELDLNIAPSDSDSFALDLTDSSEGKSAPEAAAGSPIDLDALGGASGLEAIDLSDSGGSRKSDSAFELELDDSSAVPPPPPPAAETELDDLSAASGGVGEQTYELDLDDGPGTPPPAPKPAPASSKAVASSSHDDLTLEMDLDDAPAVTPASSAAPTLELDLDDQPLSTAPKSGGDDLLDSMASMASAAGLNASAGGSAIDSRVASAAGSAIGDRVPIEGEGSGSGLLDLTSDSESSSIGAALMEDAFSSEDGADLPANASGIFGGEEGGEAAETEVVTATAVASAAAAKGGRAAIFTSAPASVREAYSGPWSGLGVGLLLPSVLGLGAAAFVVTLRVMGSPAELATMYAQDWMMWTGGLAGAVLLCGGIGFFVGRATE